jgi:tetratricopeptide (TPR) repeat protein
LNYVAGLPYYYARNYGKAIECCGKALDLDPNFFPAQHLMGLAHLQEGRFSDAINHQPTRGREKAIPSHTIRFGALGAAYALAGRPNEAVGLLKELELIASQRYVSPYFISTILAGLDQPVAALDNLELACKLCCCRVAWLRVDPLLDKLRPEPRFEAIIQRVNLHD